MSVSASLGPDSHAGVRIAMLYGVYDTLWTLALILTSPWWVFRSLMHPPTRCMVRERLTLNLKSMPATTGRPRVLIHGVSVGGGIWRAAHQNKKQTLQFF